MIATQYDNPQTADFVRWTHADPLTGSSQEVDKDGAGYDYLRKELEPLGQEVQAVEPPTEPPVGLPAVSFSVSSPEWLCRNPNQEYSQMPVSCQRAENESLAYSLEIKQGASNPARIADAPLPEFDFSPSDEMMGY